MSREQADLLRKAPRQQRAATTVDTIVVSAAQILHEEGDGAVNTNRIAERAGFSIGTLYQYFPNKQAILLTYVGRERERIRALVIEAMRERSGDDLSALLHRVVRVMTDAFGRNHRVYRFVVLRLLDERLLHLTASTIEEISQVLAAEINSGRFAQVRACSPLRIFVLTRAMVGAVRASTMDERGRQFEKSGVEAEVVRMAIAYLTAE